MKNRPKAGKNPAIKHPMRRYKPPLLENARFTGINEHNFFVVLFDIRKNCNSQTMLSQRK